MSSQSPDSDAENNYLATAMAWSWLTLVGVTIGYTVAVRANAYIRTIACLNNETQRYFNTTNYFHGAFKKYLLDAPMFRKRHHREFRLSSALNMGIIPSRIQSLFLIAYLVMAITLTTYKIDYKAPMDEILNTFVDRTGILATWNMLPLFLLSSRNNPLLALTGITFDTYNLIHRWLGRIVVAEVIVHGATWLATKVTKQGLKDILTSENSSSQVIGGTIAGFTFIALLLHSPSVIRHAFYETFLYLHILLVMTSIGALWYHFGQFPMMKQILCGVIAIWVLERTLRMARIIYHNVGKGGTRAECEVLPGDVVRVTMKLARPWRFQPGQHAYIYMPSVGFHTNHPFTVAWSEEEQDTSMEKLPLANQDILEMRKTSVSFIVRRRTGFTDSLWKKAQNSSSGKFTTAAFLEGPYGSQNLHSYGTVLLFAAGVGITHQVPHVRDLVAGYSNRTVAARKIVLVWIIQSPEHLEWIRPWMTSILAQPKRRDVLKILLFVTRPRSTKEIQSPSATVQMFPGKPNVRALLDQEVGTAVGAIGVSVCGVGALADEVRKGCRTWMDRVNIDFFEESFTW